MTLLSVLGLLGCAITLSLCLVTLGLLSRSLTVRRPGGVLLLLVVAPDVLKQALPQVPSVLALQSWLVNMSLRGI